MPRILSVDYGAKRSGIAVTDPLMIIASALTTVPSHTLMDFLKDYFLKEEVSEVVFGMPKNTDGTDTNATQHKKSSANISLSSWNNPTCWTTPDVCEIGANLLPVCLPRPGCLQLQKNQKSSEKISGGE